MPDKPKHFCNKPGCGRLTNNRFCEQHQAADDKQYNERRGSAHAQGYDRAWVAVRNLYLAQFPLCEICEAKGKLTPAVLVHHKKPIKEGGALLDSDNLQSLCNSCHEDIHGKERFKRTV